MNSNFISFDVKFMALDRIEYVMSCYSVTLQLSEGSHVAKHTKGTRLQENRGLPTSLWWEVNHIWPAA